MLVQHFHLLCCNVAAVVAEYVDLEVSFLKRRSGGMRVNPII